MQVCIVRGKNGAIPIDPLASDNAKLHCSRVKAVYWAILGPIEDHFQSPVAPRTNNARLHRLRLEQSVWHSWGNKTTLAAYHNNHPMTNGQRTATNNQQLTINK